MREKILPKKKISYSTLPIENPLESLNQYLSDGSKYLEMLSEKEELRTVQAGREEQDASNKKIEFNSLSGKLITLNLPDTQHSKRQQFRVDQSIS